jgi:hypothetical protein
MRRLTRLIHFSLFDTHKISSTMAPPVGLPLGTEHVIGRLIGKGAFAYMRLWAENLIYSAQCRSLTGTLLPKLPGKMQDGLVHFYDKVGGTSRTRVVV